MARVAPVTADAGSQLPGSPDEFTLTKAKEIVSSHERILAIYEPTSSQACPARWQCSVDLALGCPLLIPCCCMSFPCERASELSFAYDHSFFVLTDENLCTSAAEPNRDALKACPRCSHRCVLATRRR